MTEVDHRRGTRAGRSRRSIRSRSLALLVVPTGVLAAAAVAAAVEVDSWAVRAGELAALALALVAGTGLWHAFASGVVRRLEDLEREADEFSAVQSELTNILTASPVVSLRYDVATRRFSYASPNVDKVIGIGAEVAMTDAGAVVERFHPEDEQRLRAALVEGRGRGDDPLSMILRVRTDPTSEEWREVDALYRVETDEGGMPRTVSAYLVDVSARQAALRAADERRFMLESIFHASPDTMVVRDANGKVLLASSALAEVIGAPGGAAVDPDTVIEEAYRYGRLRREERAALDRMLARCLAGDTELAPVVTTGRTSGGHSELRTFETRARPILDDRGQVTGTVTVSRDITDRIRLEQSLRRATSEAERASAAKSQFLSRMSHELRTPLNAILGFAQLLELDELPPDQASSVEQIERAGRHLLSLINEVLDITRIEAGQLPVASDAVSVVEILDEITTLLAPVAEAAAVHMMVEHDLQDCFVRADRQRLRQVLLNLGSNAVKYNEAGGTAAFRTALTAAGRLRFSVHDSGPGIPHEQQHELFVPFSRLGAERSGVEGTGVGLALSKQLVELMGGSIGVDSAPGHGSTFWVELQAAEAPSAPATDGSPAPAAQGSLHSGSAGAGSTNSGSPAAGSAGAEAGSPGAGPGASGSPLTVLYVEDDESNAALVRLVLARRPQVRLVSAVDARLGMELARQHRPQLLLLDLHLPDLSGDELLGRIKAMPELADTKVVVVSADATHDRIRRVLDQGVEGYLTKPIDVEALLHVIDDQLVRRSAPAR